MAGIPPPPKINPSALALGQAAMEAIAKSKIRVGVIKGDDNGAVHVMPDRRDNKVPAGMKKMYTKIPHHQGKKEMARRLKQMAREKK